MNRALLLLGVVLLAGCVAPSTPVRNDAMQVVPFERAVITPVYVEFFGRARCGGKWEWSGCNREVVSVGRYNYCTPEILLGRSPAKIRRTVLHETLHCMGYAHSPWFYTRLEKMVSTL